jgi:hypothetical protein
MMGKRQEWVHAHGKVGRGWQAGMHLAWAGLPSVALASGPVQVYSMDDPTATTAADVYRCACACECLCMCMCACQCTCVVPRSLCLGHPSLCDASAHTRNRPLRFVPARPPQFRHHHVRDADIRAAIR